MRDTVQRTERAHGSQHLGDGAESGSALQAAPVGLVVPPGHGNVPTDAPLVYPNVPFTSIGLGLTRMESADYSAATARIVDKAELLAARGAAAIGIMGTSLTFFEGADGNRRVEGAVTAATGLPCVSMSTGLVEGLRSVGSTNPVLASAYSSEVHLQLAAYLAEEGLRPWPGAHLDIVDLAGLEDVGPKEVMDLGIRAWECSGGVGDALVLSCGGFRTRGAMLVLEEALGVPVISSAVAGLWAVTAAAGYDPRVPSLGSLLNTRPGLRS